MNTVSVVDYTSNEAHDLRPDTPCVLATAVEDGGENMPLLDWPADHAAITLESWAHYLPRGGYAYVRSEDAAEKPGCVYWYLSTLGD